MALYSAGGEKKEQNKGDHDDQGEANEMLPHHAD
jgi:hypothetical protein